MTPVEWLEDRYDSIADSALEWVDGGTFVRPMFELFPDEPSAKHHARWPTPFAFDMLYTSDLPA